MSNIKPLLDRALVKVDKTKESTKGGIILAGKSKEQPLIATVVAVGPGGIVDGKEIKMYVQRGDKVIINKYAGSEITIDEEEYTILRQSDILAVLD